MQHLQVPNSQGGARRVPTSFIIPAREERHHQEGISGVDTRMKHLCTGEFKIAALSGQTHKSRYINDLRCISL